jgi:hypothetical protein
MIKYLRLWDIRTLILTIWHFVESPSQSQKRRKRHNEEKGKYLDNMFIHGKHSEDIKISTKTD